MFEIVFTMVMVITAYRIGTLRAVNQDIVKQTAHMQDLIDQAYEKRDHIKTLWLDAEDRATGWENRYWDLYEELRSIEVEQEDEEVGS
jgi:hypothetical protein